MRHMFDGTKEVKDEAWQDRGTERGQESGQVTNRRGLGVSARS